MKRTLFNQGAVIAFMGTSLVAGCSSDNGGAALSGSGLSGTVSKIGSMQIADENSDFLLDMSAIFIELQEPISVSGFETQLARRSMSEDNCEVYVGTEDDYVPSDLDEALDSGTIITAGEVITVGSAAGSLGELQPGAVFGNTDFVIYTGEVQASQETANGLIVDIPEGEFPAFSAIAVPDVIQFELTTEIPPANNFGTEVAIDSTFNWDPVGDAGSRITLTADVTANSNLFDETRRAVIDCVLQDDGSFTLGADVQTQLNNFGFTSLPLAIGRESIIIRQQGDAIVVLSRSSGVDP